MTSEATTRASASGPCVACLITVGATSDNADAVVDVLVAADMRGVLSHGVNRLEIYIAGMEIDDATAV